MDEKMIQLLSNHFKDKSTSELSKILSENDRSQYTEEAIQAIREILLKRDETKIKMHELENQNNLVALQAVIKCGDSLFISEDEKNEAIDALVRIGDPDILETLGKDTTLYTPARVKAILEIGKTGSTRSLNGLISLLNDPDKTIRSGAVEAINKIDASPLRLRKCQRCNESILLGTSQEIKICPECGSAFAIRKELIPTKKTAALIRSLIFGVLIGILADLILIAIGVSLYIWALSKGGIPFHKFAPGYTERSIAILVATFIVFSFSAITLSYNRLLKESGKASNSFVAYAISSVIAFISIMALFPPTKSKLGDAVFFAVVMALCLPGVALVLLEKVQKYIKLK